jgi:hypothetical protein
MEDFRFANQAIIIAVGRLRRMKEESGSYGRQYCRMGLEEYIRLFVPAFFSGRLRVLFGLLQLFGQVTLTLTLHLGLGAVEAKYPADVRLVQSEARVRQQPAHTVQQ